MIILEKKCTLILKEERERKPKIIYAKCIGGDENIYGTEIELEVFLYETVADLKKK